MSRNSVLEELSVRRFAVWRKVMAAYRRVYDSPHLHTHRKHTQKGFLKRCLTVMLTNFSVHQAAKLVAALLRVAGVTAGQAESNGSLPSGL